MPLSIEPPNTAAKTYLQAIGAAAIYVSVDNGIPVSVGVARDLNVALRNMQRIISPNVQFGWVSWASDYNKLVEISKVPDLIYIGANAVLRAISVTGTGPWDKTVLPLDHVVRRIEVTARENGITLTPHYKAIERASTYSEQLDNALAAMQAAGLLKTFNQAYRAHRLRQGRAGESAAHYFTVMGVLRGIIVRLLVANAFSTDAALEEIRKRFPWFTRFRQNGRKHKGLTDWRKRNSRA